MWFRWLSASFLIAVLACAALWGRMAEQRYNLLIISTESWRAEALTPQLTPAVLAAAQNGRVYTGHRAISAWTIPNVVALLTGVSPFEQGIHRRGDQLAANRSVPLAELAREGWLVAGLQAFMTIPEFGNLGLSLSPGEEPMPWLARRALDGRRFVLWHHYLGTHLPYAPDQQYRPDWKALLPPGDQGAVQRLETVMTKPVIPVGSVAFQPSDAGAITALHNGSYRQFDAWFADLWRFLDRSGLLENTIVLLTADHGDEHLEHGRVGHASTNHDGHLHEEVVRVPLILWLPPSHPLSASAHGVETVPTDHLMVMPALARLVRGAAPPPGSLLSPPPDRPWQAVTSRGGFQTGEDDSTFLAAAALNGWKAMQTWRGGKVVDQVLYDLTADPGEHRPIPGPHPLHDVLARALPILAPSNSMAAPAGALAQAPRWVWPAASGTVGYDALGGRVRLEWSGPAGVRHRIEYEAGEGDSRFVGSMDVDGTVKDFGALDRKYWETFVVPYGRVRLRVGAGGQWSEWLDMRVTP